MPHHSSNIVVGSRACKIWHGFEIDTPLQFLFFYNFLSFFCNLSNDDTKFVKLKKMTARDINMVLQIKHVCECGTA